MHPDQAYSEFWLGSNSYLHLGTWLDPIPNQDRNVDRNSVGDTLSKIILRIIIPNVIQGPILRNFKIVLPMVLKIIIHLKALQKILRQILFKVLFLFKMSSSFPGSLVFPPCRRERGETLAQAGHVIFWQLRTPERSPI